jgi:hypothetical protein
MQNRKNNVKISKYENVQILRGNLKWQYRNGSLPFAHYQIA